MAVNIGPRISIEGDAEFNKSLKGIVEQTKTLKTEMTKLEKSFDDDTSAKEKNAKKTEILTDMQKNLQTRVEECRKAVEASKAQFGENAAQTEKWKQALNNAETELGEVNAELENLTPLKTWQAEMETVSSKLTTIGDSMKSVGSTLSTHVTAPVVAAGAAAFKMASDYEENLNKVEVAFGSNADQVTAWAETATEQFGLSKNAALEATSYFGDMGTSMGLSSQDAADMATSLAGLAGDLSSFKNVDIDQAMNALGGVFTGETESLKGLGVVMNETNLKGFAEDIGLNYDEMSQAEKVTLRYKYVLASTQNAQGDYARTSDGAANSMRTLQAEVSNLGVSFGEEILPVITPLIGKVTELVHSFGSLDDNTKKTILTVAGIAAAAGPVLMVIGSVVSGVGSVIGVVGKLGPAIMGLNPTMLLVVGGIAAAVAAGVLLYENWDTIKEKAGELKEKIDTKFDEIKTKISETWDNVKTKTSETMDELKSFTSTTLSSMQKTFEEKGGGIKGASAALMTGLQSVYTAGFNKIDSLTGGKLTKIKNLFTTTFNNAKSIVSDALTRIKGLFNFTWSFPKLKMPHFSWSWQSIGGLVSIPKISVSWYAKAMEDGMILNRPTIFGASGGSLLGAGEAGSETVVGTGSLIGMIRQAVREGMGFVPDATGTTNYGGVTVNVYGAPGQDVEELADIIEERMTANVLRREGAWA